MTEQEIRADRGSRADECKKEIEAILGKYQFTLVAEDNWTPYSKVTIEVQFKDLKKYDAPIAQEENPIVTPENSTPQVAPESVPEAPVESPYVEQPQGETTV